MFLAEDVRDRERIMRALSQDLGEVRRLLPPQALSVISDARLYFNGKYHYGLERKRGMCVHWSADWLRSIGDLPEKAGHIECYCADEYLNTTRPEQPACILHELSHCYHQRRLDAIDEMISDAYCKVPALLFPCM